MSIAFKEGLKIPPQAMDQIIIGANQDVRQVGMPWAALMQCLSCMVISWTYSYICFVSLPGSSQYEHVDSQGEESYLWSSQRGCSQGTKRHQNGKQFPDFKQCPPSVKWSSQMITFWHLKETCTLFCTLQTQSLKKTELLDCTVHCTPDYFTKQKLDNVLTLKLVVAESLTTRILKFETTARLECEHVQHISLDNRFVAWWGYFTPFFTWLDAGWRGPNVSYKIKCI